jgi:hypothetical protein
MRFALESSEALSVGREEVGQHLERDVTTQSRIARSIHLAHPAHTDPGEDLVGTETNP